MGSLCCCLRTNHASQAQPHNTSRPLSTKLATAAIVVGSIAFILCAVK
ncbi:MAG: hypothetical protein JSS62_06500, partial [Verrucomicrobia bacterium]|nr:hypothetical protein [Verrucomicrobiota bacterium]